MKIKQVVAISVLVFGIVAAVQAQSVWDGSGSGANNNARWNNSKNWNTLPVPGATYDLQFATSQKLINTNDFATGSDFRNITFNSGAGAFTLNGNEIDLFGSITNNSANAQTINLAMSLTTGVHNVNAASGNIALGGVLSGNGSLTKSGTNTLTLTGANTYGGATVISAGTLQVGNGGTTGTLGAGNVTNNSILAFNRSNAYIVSNAISGSGSLTKSGAGTTTLVGANSYSGPTTISVGTLQIGNGGTTGTLGTGNVTNNSILAFNRSNAMTVSNVISGSGSVTKSGAGTLTLTAANTYTNTTTVSFGGLIVNGSLLSKQLTVSVGALLGGTGTVQAVTMDAGSILSVGNSPGTMTFNGALLLSAGSTNIMEMVSASLYDVLKGTGGNTLTMNGVTLFDFTGNTTVSNGSAFAMFQNWGTVNTVGATFTAIGLADGLSIDASQLATTGYVEVIPEPMAVSLLGFGAVASILGHRLRQRNRLAAPEVHQRENLHGARDQWREGGRRRG